MSQPYVGQIILVGFNFAPNGWMFCNGQLLAISNYVALFQLIGTTYGGDGQSTFALPDLRGRIPISMGQGPGLQSYVIGEQGGAEAVTLAASQLPAHTHTVNSSNLTAAMRCTTGSGNQQGPAGNVPATEAAGVTMTYSSAAADMPMNPAAVTPGPAVPSGVAGGIQTHNNMQSYLGLNYCISLFGIFPSQT
jgi:microcystin-dependent protein